MRAAAILLARCMGMIMPARGPTKLPLRISKAFGVRSAAPAGQCEMPAKTDTPRWIEAILSWPWLLPVARIALTSSFLIGGIQKLLRNPVVRADVEKVEDVLGGFFEVDIAPDEPDQDIGRHQRQPSLKRLHKRNRPQARPMGVASPDLAFVHGGDTAHP